MDEDNDRAPRVQMVSRTSRNMVQWEHGVVELGEGRKIRRMTDERSKTRLTRMFLVMQTVHWMVRLGRRVTQRELFYLLRRAFDSQTQVNEMVLDVSGVIGVLRYAMSIGAATCGVMAGCIQVGLSESTSFVDCDGISHSVCLKKVTD